MGECGQGLDERQTQDYADYQPLPQTSCDHSSSKGQYMTSAVILSSCDYLVKQDGNRYAITINPRIQAPLVQGVRHPIYKEPYEFHMSIMSFFLILIISLSQVNHLWICKCRLWFSQVNLQKPTYEFIITWLKIAGQSQELFYQLQAYDTSESYLWKSLRHLYLAIMMPL